MNACFALNPAMNDTRSTEARLAVQHVYGQSKFSTAPFEAFFHFVATALTAILGTASAGANIRGNHVQMMEEIQQCLQAGGLVFLRAPLNISLECSSRSHTR